MTARHSAAEHDTGPIMLWGATPLPPPPTPPSEGEAELMTELGWLHSKDGLLDLLDEHWPPDMSPAEDPSPRVRSLARRLAVAEETFADIEALHTAGEWGTCACCAWPWPCQTVQYIWGAEDDRG